jgi:transcriptional pleiotropic repressor
MQLLEKFYEIKGLLKKENLTEMDLVGTISSSVECDTYLINSTGNIQCSATTSGKASDNPNLSMKPEFKQRLDFIFETAANLPLENGIFKEEKNFQPDTFMTIVPIRNIQSVLGYLLLIKPNKPFSGEELVLCETASLVAVVFFYENYSLDGTSDDRLKANAQMVLDSLSFSELKAISNVFKDLNGSEGFLVASKIADRIGISRSVIVNAMRKLESAGIVDSRSLGIKGTYIKIKNLNFLEVLKTRVR